MGIPYRARVNERTSLNLPGFDGRLYVYVYVEDTSERDLQHDPYCDADCDCCPQNFEPRMVLEIADRRDVIGLDFEIDTAEARQNSLYQLETLAAALRVFRGALEAEFEPYDARQRRVDALQI